jgi:hypothetical protein
VQVTTGEVDDAVSAGIQIEPVKPFKEVLLRSGVRLDPHDEDFLSVTFRAPVPRGPISTAYCRSVT